MWSFAPTNAFLTFISDNDKFCVRRNPTTDNRNNGKKRKQFPYRFHVLRGSHSATAVKIHFQAVVARENIEKVFVRQQNEIRHPRLKQKNGKKLITLLLDLHLLEQMDNACVHIMFLSRLDDELIIVTCFG